MTLTTGLILRRITETALSVSAHKLATLILDGIAWKDGYDGLPRGTAAFTLAALGEKMGVSRQHLSVLLAELAASGLRLSRRKPHGKFAPWLFRFGTFDDAAQEPADMSGIGDTSLSESDSHKTIFSGEIDITASTNVFQTPWATLIKAAKTTLPCWDVDIQTIWDRFLAFNRARGNHRVPAGYLLGFMRRWRQRRDPAAAPSPRHPHGQEVEGNGRSTDLRALTRQILAAPSANRQFHASDLCAVIGAAAYESRICETINRFGCQRFTAALAVHGSAVLAGEIAR